MKFKKFLKEYPYSSANIMTKVIRPDGTIIDNLNIEKHGFDYGAESSPLNSKYRKIAHWLNNNPKPNSGSYPFYDKERNEIFMVNHDTGQGKPINGPDEETISKEMIDAMTKNLKRDNRSTEHFKLTKILK